MRTVWDTGWVGFCLFENIRMADHLQRCCVKSLGNFIERSGVSKIVLAVVHL
jgi:hypothetical protein